MKQCRVCNKKLTTPSSKKRGVGGGCLRKLLKEKFRIETRLFEIECLLDRKL